MTLGEKIKEARKQCGLSQEQLAEKLAVSRSAIAKWEAGNGLPDVDNLKALAQLLHVSIDDLLDDSRMLEKAVLREAYDLSDYGKGIKKKKKDRVIREKFPDAEIHTLLGEQKPTKVEKIVDNALGWLTTAPFGVPQFINGIKSLDKEFYLIEKDGKQFFVTVTDTFIETRQLTKRITADQFEVGSWKFTRCAYEVKEECAGDKK